MDDEVRLTAASAASQAPASQGRVLAEVLDQQQRLKREMNLTRELIDFDLIKGSALFHTKPSSHDRKLVQEGFTRALFIPFHAKFWRQKPWIYETATALYLLHGVAVCIYIFYNKSTSPHNTFEVFFPIFLGDWLRPRVERIAGARYRRGGQDPLPIIKQAEAMCSSESDTSLAASGLGSALAESENSDGTDSDEESGNSSSSSDESNPNDDMFPHKSSSAPTSPKRVRLVAALYFFEVQHRKNSLVLDIMQVMRPSICKPPMSLPPRVPLMSGGLDSVADQFARRRVTVCVWEDGFPVKRAMSITELRNTILAKVRRMCCKFELFLIKTVAHWCESDTDTDVYRKVAEVSAVILALVPIALRCVIKCQEFDCVAVTQEPVEVLSWIFQLSKELSAYRLYMHAQELASGASIISISCMLSTYYLASRVFAALADAEVTYHRRFLYAKCFTALTSSRRSRLANLPHFRLKNVVNIKAWISLRGGRTWLKRQGRQRAADEIVSTSFLIILVLLVVMGMQAVSDGSGSLSPETIVHIEVAIWCMLSSVFMLRFMMLGSNINKKYQNTSLLLTEQMNVYLRLLAKPHKKEKLLVSNNVLKLACKLLKELNSPNKVSGLTMNPLLYNITRVVVLSAFSSTASDFFGFKLKLWKLKA
ncbi:Transcription factor homeodomain, male germ-cell [Phytophthora cactorum]|nr:Transcription factor homeodomain, male germ-cell [Phytophthora cactorum]